MNNSHLDADLAHFLAPPQRDADRLFAARVDDAVEQLTRLRQAEHRYIQGLGRDILALGASLLAGLLLAWGGSDILPGVTALLALLPALSLLLIMVGVKPPVRHLRPDI